MRKTTVTLCALFVGAGFAIPGMGMDDVAPPRHPGTTFLSMPKVRLAELRSPDGAAPFELESVAARAREWARQGESAADPLIQARFLLSAANSALSFETAHALTHAVLELSSDDVDAPARTDHDSARRVIAEASQWITQAQLLLERVQTAGGERGDPEANDGNDLPAPNARERERADKRRLSRAAATLAAFSQAFMAYLASPDEPSTYRQSREAATALAPILEDSDPAVAAAAKFWQSALRSREDDPTPALLRLDLVNVTPDQQTQPHALFSRLMRCRLIARHGSAPAGMAMLLQLEERCHDWFPSERRRDEALRAVVLTRLKLLHDWHEQAQAGGHSDEATWCVDQARRLIEKQFDDESFVMLLAPTIPVLIDAPPATAPVESATPRAD